MRKVRKPPAPASEKWGGRLDGWIGVVAPAWAEKRAYARIRTGLRLSVYRGASKGRIFEDWTTTPDDDEEALSWELPDLRQRSRDLVRNNAIAESLISTIVTKVVGPGLTPQSLATEGLPGLADSDAAEAWRNEAEDAWREWARGADVAGKLTFGQMQRLALRRMLIDGDVFLVRQMARRKGIRTAWKMVGGERVLTPGNLTSEKNILNGIKYNKSGRPVSYFIRKHQARTSLAQDFQEIKARDRAGRPNVIHLFLPIRVDQTRGVPILAPALPVFKQFESYLEAMLVRARVEACISGFVKSAAPLSHITPRTSETDGDNRRLETLAPGQIEYLREGEDISFIAPTNPGRDFEAFIKRLIRMIAAAVGLPYELAAKDYSESNYSNSRMASLDGRDVFEDMRAYVSGTLCQPVWELVLEEGVLRGVVPEAGYDVAGETYSRTRWGGRGWPSVDPEKDAAGDLLKLRIGSTTVSDLCNREGADWKDNFKQREEEEAERARAGLPPLFDTKEAPGAGDDDEAENE
ncbi:MAG TPA: phage portal protein [Phycisphaerae bacterium]|nr:phage portal protein [Phycisphaerae bacterium]HUX15092.1 phage portal protein [Phycisphaerae bacterium]